VNDVEDLQIAGGRSGSHNQNRQCLRILWVTSYHLDGLEGDDDRRASKTWMLYGPLDAYVGEEDDEEGGYEAEGEVSELPLDDVIELTSSDD
jgi:hypothetical protein